MIATSVCAECANKLQSSESCRIGIAVITQGLVNIMKPDEVKKLFGTVEKGYLELSSQLATEMRS